MRYIDLNDDVSRQIIVDKEEGQYLGHVTTVLLEDQKTMIAVYPKGHGRGGIIQKMSFDAGLTWSERMQLPDSFETSMEVPTIYRTYDANGKTEQREWAAWVETVTLQVVRAEDVLAVHNAGDIPMTVANEHAMPTENTLYLGSSAAGTPEDVCAVLNQYYS